MSLSICQKLNIGELKPSTISLQLVDKSIKYPIGILRNIPIKVGKIFIPIWFYCLRDRGRFLDSYHIGNIFLSNHWSYHRCERQAINSQSRRKKKLEFNLFRAMKHKPDIDECLRVNIINKLVEEEFYKRCLKDNALCTVIAYTMTIRK